MAKKNGGKAVAKEPEPEFVGDPEKVQAKDVEITADPVVIPAEVVSAEKEHLLWIYERMVGVHGENPSMDYMIKLKEIIDGK